MQGCRRHASLQHIVALDIALYPTLATKPLIVNSYIRTWLITEHPWHGMRPGPPPRGTLEHPVTNCSIRVRCCWSISSTTYTPGLRWGLRCIAWRWLRGRGALGVDPTGACACLLGWTKLGHVLSIPALGASQNHFATFEADTCMYQVTGSLLVCLPCCQHG